MSKRLIINSKCTNSEIYKELIKKPKILNFTFNNNFSNNLNYISYLDSIEFNIEKINDYLSELENNSLLSTFLTKLKCRLITNPDTSLMIYKRLYDALYDFGINYIEFIVLVR